MLVLSRKKGESLVINGDITVTVLDVQNDKIKVGITAPKNITIFRKELYDKITTENIEASKAASVPTDQVSLVEALLKRKK